MIEEKAYAKINLTLDVIKKREDGYHELEMIMSAIDLYDILFFSNSENNEVTISSNNTEMPLNEDNLIYKIIMHLKSEFNIIKGVSVYVEKNIPMAAGLAGGSADAAATLRGINRLWNLNLTLDEMAKIGIKFGADIPFCLYNKLAHVKGIGEKITFLKRIDKFKLIIINPNIKVSTKEVFESVNIDKLSHPNTEKMLESIVYNDYDGICENLGNSLEGVTFNIFPKIKKIKMDLSQFGVDGVLMSGSGSTLFALVQNDHTIKEIINKYAGDFYIKSSNIL